ncbi:hypothetical protein Poli38472_005881 [Pythium oligandrum]|uniref:Uncharacterized protein n=1 Tax=Pythium oligandrum TaxID=41045 RepID=A0A8K1FSC7_PYTOL|nr:hypothetical protein Poli38472_005881 [Pythium oligandrum]|eukprot:TMW68413.1 hypothetical protein Poli38472_005881 [Pythium oligandrum]
MPSLASIVSSKSKSSGTLAVVPLVIASAAIAGYARSTASHHHMEAAKDKEEQHKHDEEVFHQHIAYPWKGTR